jgi:hypothetical protein
MVVGTGVMARVHEAQSDKSGRVWTLREALKCDPADVVLKHQLGVALSKVGQNDGGYSAVFGNH